MTTFSHSRIIGYEVSSKGDINYSAFAALLKDGRTIEQHYQLDAFPRGKGYDPGGTNWRLGKGKPPIDPKMTRGLLWGAYLNLWREHFKLFPNKLLDLKDKLEEIGETYLRDRFAMTEINQARALSVLLNELTGKETKAVYIGIVNSHHQKQWKDPRVFYAGRGSPLGNPFQMKDKSDRDRVCEEYQTWFKRYLNTNEELLMSLNHLEDKAKDGVIYLRCYCHPARCHTETIKKELFTRLINMGYEVLDKDPSL